jgi:glycosyltransferase involved in cell wall biosynthesis
MASRPLVTIGMQFFNNERSLADAIKSILLQTYENWELIIHDDGSTDKSYEIAASFTDPRILLKKDFGNRGRAVHLNQCLHLARGDYFAVADADDIAHPERIRLQLNSLLKNSDVDLIGAGMLLIDKYGVPKSKRVYPECHAEICRLTQWGILMAQPTFMGRTAWFRKYLYDERFFRAQDQELLLRSYSRSVFANLPDILVGYHTSGSTLRKILRTRYWHSRAISHNLLFAGFLFRGVQGIIGELLKTIFELCMHIVGVREIVITLRGTSINASQRAEWMGIMAATSKHSVGDRNLEKTSEQE